MDDYDPQDRPRTDHLRARPRVKFDLEQDAYGGGGGGGGEDMLDDLSLGLAELEDMIRRRRHGRSRQRDWADDEDYELSPLVKRRARGPPAPQYEPEDPAPASRPPRRDSRPAAKAVEAPLAARRGGRHRRDDEDVAPSAMSGGIFGEPPKNKKNEYAEELRRQMAEKEAAKREERMHRQQPSAAFADTDVHNPKNHNRPSLAAAPQPQQHHQYHPEAPPPMAYPPPGGYGDMMPPFMPYMPPYNAAPPTNSPWPDPRALMVRWLRDLIFVFSHIFFFFFFKQKKKKRKKRGGGGGGMQEPPMDPYNANMMASGYRPSSGPPRRQQVQYEPYDQAYAPPAAAALAHAASPPGDAGMLANIGAGVTRPVRCVLYFFLKKKSK